MDNCTIVKLDVFIAKNRLLKKTLASFLSVPNSQISYWIKNSYYIIQDKYGYCELVKMHRNFNIADIPSNK